MQTLLACLRLFPALLASVRALEDAIPLPSAGKARLELLLATVKAVYDAEETIRKEIPWERLAGIISSAVKTVVDAFHALGLFRRTAAG
jgi:hypothetical protein